MRIAAIGERGSKYNESAMCLLCNVVDSTLTNSRGFNQFLAGKCKIGSAYV